MKKASVIILLFLFSSNVFAEKSSAYNAGYAVGSALRASWPYSLGIIVIYLGYRFFFRKKVNS